MELNQTHYPIACTVLPFLRFFSLRILFTSAYTYYILISPYIQARADIIISAFSVYNNCHRTDLQRGGIMDIGGKLHRLREEKGLF